MIKIINNFNCKIVFSKTYGRLFKLPFQSMISYGSSKAVYYKNNYEINCMNGLNLDLVDSKTVSQSIKSIFDRYEHKNYINLYENDIDNNMNMIINEFAESRTEEKNMEEKQIQNPDVNAGAEERDNYTLIQETPEDDLPGENGIAIRYSKDFNIVQANELLRSKQSDLTLMESKLIRLAVSQIMKGDKDLRTYKVNVSQLAEFLEVPKTNVYRSMQDINISLMQRVIFIRDKEVPDKKGKPNYKILHWLSSVEYKDGTLTYRLSDELKPYLIGLSEMFTLYSYDSIIKLPTNYSIRLFELLTSWVNIIIKGENTPAFPDISTDPDEIVLAIDYLRDFFDCNDKYKSAGDFVRNVIEVNLGFINQYTNLKVSFRKHKKGRSISHVIFKYENTWNNDPKAEEHNNQMLDTIRSIKNGEPAQFETDKEVITF